MTMMVAAVATAAEAEVAIAAGADIVELRRAEPGPAALVSLREVLAAVRGRCPIGAYVGDAFQSSGMRDARALLDCGLDFLRVPLAFDEASIDDARALSDAAGSTRLIGAISAESGGDPEEAAAWIAGAAFSGLMLDAVDPPAGRLLTQTDVPTLAAFVRSARARGLLVGFAGGLEPPDVPRLLQLGPDLLGFDRSLRNELDAIEEGRVAAIRALVPRASAPLSAGRGGPGRAEANSPGREVRTVAQRIFVRDLVLPVRIGAYSDERSAPQKVRFNVSVELEAGTAEPTGMSQVLSYDLITDGIAAIVAEGHVDLAEALAQRIAAHVLGDPRARRVTVMVEKLERGPAVVGVEIVAERAGDGQN
jgi:dihydroneopterin aldolase